MFRRNFLLLLLLFARLEGGVEGGGIYARNIFRRILCCGRTSSIKRTETFGHVPLACNKRCEILPG